MADRNFVTRNGLVVNSDLIVANGGSNRVGIKTSTPDATLTVNGTANVSGNVTISGNLTATFINVGSATINSTIFSGTANNATNLGGNPSSFYTNATNLSTGTVPSARLPVSNTTQAGIVQLVDSVTNTSITIAATANSVKFVYDSIGSLGSTAYTNAIAQANIYANNAYNNAIAQANIYANNAYNNGTSYADTRAATAYSNAITFSANATNLTNGTVPSARLPVSNTTQAGIVQLVDAINNTSITIAAAANSVKLAYDTAILANTRAASAQTAADSAYTNAVTFSANANNISSGTLNTARLTGAYSGITQVGTQETLSVSGNTTLPNFILSTNSTSNTLSVGNSTIAVNVNFDNATLAIDAVNNRVGVNTATPDTTFQIIGNANISGNLAIGGNFTVTGNLVTTGTTTATGDFNPTSNGFNLGNTTARWNLFGHNTINTTGNVVVGGNVVVTGFVTSGANVVANNTHLRVGNATVYVSMNSSLIETSGGISTLSNSTFSSWISVSNTISVGNSTVNVSVNSTVFSGTSNNATNLGGNPSSFYLDATNINAGTINTARLPQANTTANGSVILLDAVNNTSISIYAPTANAVKTAYDAAIAANTRAASAQTAATSAYTNAITIASNADNLTSGTVNTARLPQANTTANGSVILLDSVVNTSIAIYAPTANAVKTAYDSAIAANTRATSAQTAATSAYTNAITFSANATNLTNGTIPSDRVNGAYLSITSLGIGANVVVNTTIITIGTVNSTANGVTLNATSINIGNSTVNTTVNATTFTGTANNATNLGGVAAASYVQNTDSRTLSGNLVFSGANNVFNTLMTVGDSTNSVSSNTTGIRIGNSSLFSTVNSTVFSGTSNNATNLGGVAAASYVQNTDSRTLSGNINFTGSNVFFTGGLTTGVVNSNFDAGLLFIDATNNRVGVNTTAPSVTLQVNSNDAIFVPRGNTSQRPVGSNGMFRYNGETGSFEGFIAGAWGSIAGAGGANTQIQFNDSGASNGSAGFTFNKTTNNVTLANSLIITGGINANGSLGTAGQTLTSNGTVVYWATSGGGGVTVNNDVTTNSNNYFLTLSTISTGTLSTATIANTKLYFNPSTGALNSTVFNSLSDVTFKKDIEIVQNPLNILEEITGVKFRWKDNNHESYGVLAQEVESVLPSLVNTNEFGKSVNYNGLISVLIEAIKVLKNRIDKLEGK